MVRYEIETTKWVASAIPARERTATMMDILFNGIGWTDIALTLNRIAVGLFFMLSGYHKLFNAERHRALADELKELGVHAVGFNQWWVPLVEFAAGAAVVFGFLAPLAALGLLVLILVAIVTSGPQRIKVYNRSMRRTGSTIGSICPRSCMSSC